MANLLAAAEGMGRMAVRVATAADRRMAVRNMVAVVVGLKGGLAVVGIAIGPARRCLAGAIEGGADAVGCRKQQDDDKFLAEMQDALGARNKRQAQMEVVRASHVILLHGEASGLSGQSRHKQMMGFRGRQSKGLLFGSHDVVCTALSTNLRLTAPA